MISPSEETRFSEKEDQAKETRRGKALMKPKGRGKKKYRVTQCEKQLREEKPFAERGRSGHREEKGCRNRPLAKVGELILQKGMDCLGEEKEGGSGGRRNQGKKESKEGRHAGGERSSSCNERLRSR